MRNRVSGLVAALCGALLLASSWTTTWANTYYVDNTNVSASDSNTGTNSALPFLTIGKGASIAVAGDTVRVLAGTYAETVNGPNSGSAGNPITYSAAPGVVVTGNGSASGGNAFRMSGKSYIVVDGFTITGTKDYGIYVATSSHMTISSNHVSYSGTPASGSTRIGIYFTGSSASLIKGNTSDHNSQDGIRLTSGCTTVTVSNNVCFANAEQWERNATGIQVTGTGSANNTIIHNIVYANEDSGLQFYSGAHDNLVIGNVSYGNGDHGIDNNTSTNNSIIGNTVQGNVTSGINLEGGSAPGSGGATVANNISVDNGIRLQVGGGTASGQPSNIRVDAQSVTGTTLDYNLYYLTTGSGGTVQVQWNGTSYTSLAAFQSAVSGQETHGLQADPLLAAPAPPAQRPAAAPFNVAVNVGDNHITAGSPAIDSANANAPSEPVLDVEGNGRVDDPATANTGAGTRLYDDRGAYEYQPPAPFVSVACPSNVTVPAALGECSSNVTFVVTATGNPTPVLECKLGPTVITSPYTFPIGTNTVNCAASNSVGTASCSFNVVVVDTQSPSITCPSLVMVNADPGACSATNVVLGTPITSDNCGISNVVNDSNGSYAVGTNNVVWTATDIHGNQSTCTQQVVVVDTQAPSITCPASVMVNTDPGSCSATNVVLDMPTTDDNCGVLSVFNDSSESYSVGTNNVVWTVTDIHGNQSTCTQQVVVSDVELPIINCPADVTVTNPAGVCCASGVVLGTATASDNCGIASLTNNAPLSFPLGTNFVLWVAQDVHGNTASCVQQVIVVLANPNADSDGDGLSDFTECLIGSDPLSNSNGFWVTGINKTGTDIKLSWLTVGNSTNVIQLASPVVGGHYTNSYINLGTVIVTGAVSVITNWTDSGAATNSPARYYRIQLHPGSPTCSP